jgi:hypothetical protein
MQGYTLFMSPCRESDQFFPWYQFVTSTSQGQFNDNCTTRLVEVLKFLTGKRTMILANAQTNKLVQSFVGMAFIEIDMALRMESHGTSASAFGPDTQSHLLGDDPFVDEESRFFVQQTSHFSFEERDGWSIAIAVDGEVGCWRCSQIF